jgi:RNA polymerase sigma-70 factor (ECF subfamily)
MIGSDTETAILQRMTPPSSAHEQLSQHIELHLGQLYSTARRLTRNPHDAEDLVADTVERAWKSIESLQDPTRIGPWLTRIMTNHFISERRKAVHRTPHEEYIEEPESDEKPFSLFERLHQPVLLWWGNPEQQFLDKLLHEDIEAALGSLPDGFRVVIVLADVEGLKYHEIAQTLDLPVGTVRSRLARARTMMQKCLWQHALDKGLVEQPKIEET